MTLERLQLIATAVAPPHHKARWLSFWNSGTHIREAFQFPTKGFKTDELESWLNKTSFWAGTRYYCPSLIHLAFCFATLFRNDLLTMIINLIIFFFHLLIFFVPFLYNLQLEEGIVQMLAKTIEEDGLEICIEGMQMPRTIDEYVQAWHNQIWEYGYSRWFKGKDAYTKTKAFEDHPNWKLAVKRVIFRFDCNGLSYY
jgi:hypothetical protein